ncbi:MAG: hypothetical protein K2O35_03015, partial [Clostridia bacterium]|nr:hypothetical protein [Clostridia bacterium]
ERLINFSITQKKIDFPTFIGDSEKPYNGGISIDGKVEFQVEYRDEYLQYVEITKPSGAQYNNVTFNGNSYKVTAYDVGKYQLDVKLKDPVNTKWKTSNNKLEFEVTKAPINLNITDPSQNEALAGAVGDKLTVYIDIDQSTIIHRDNTLDIKITASSQGVPTLAISEVITLDENDRQVPVTLDLSDLMGNKQYTIGVSTESGNYEPKVVSSTTLDVTPAPTRTVLTWNLYSDGLLVRGQYKDADISQSETAVTLPSNLTYNGKRYTFKVSVPTGYKVDPDYGVGGFLVVPSTNSNNNVGINADTYTTKIRLIENASGNKQEYSISWTVDPAKFDLSQVKWQYDGQLPYDKVNGSEAILDPKTLPVGLDPHYSNNTGTTVGTSGTAYVTFTLASGYEGNYVLPEENDPDSYIDPNEDFVWNKSWNIVKAVIQSSSWKNSSTTVNDKAFDIPVLRDPNADGDVVKYEYYECDSNGNILNQTPISVDDIVLSESEAKFYKAKPVLQDTLNYELDDSEALSKVFRVGKDLTKVQVSLEKDTMEYNTNPRHAKVSVANGALPTTAFDLTYYDGYTRLATAPTEVGKYRVEVSLKLSYIDKYQIEGDYEFDYEITKAQIAEDWNDNIKPPTLKLK